MPVVALALMLATLLSPAATAPQHAAPLTGTVTGIVLTRQASAVSNATVQLRNLTSSTVVTTARTNPKGEFVFEKIEAGRYVVEAVALKGEDMTIVGTSQPFTLAAGESVATKVTIGPAPSPN